MDVIIENNDKLISPPIQNFPFILSLSYNFTSINLYENSNDPIFKLLENFEQINDILKMDKSEIIRYLYFNRLCIHGVLYDSDKTIKITFLSNKENKDLSNYFYLILLIRDNDNIVDYLFSIDLIKEINIEVNNINENHKLIILSKIIIELINYYKVTPEYDEEDEEDEEEVLKEILVVNEERIKNNINILEEIELDINKFKNCRIDKIYLEIIKSLIKNKKLENDSINNLMNELDLENIYITKTMFEELNKFLIDNENYINDYKISNIKDFFNEKTMNFYYIFFKYILKDSIFIYNISFLLKAKIIIIKNIKFELETLSFPNIDINNKEKIKYILKVFTDSEYYYKKFIDYFEQITRRSYNYNSLGSSYYNANNINNLKEVETTKDEYQSKFINEDFNSNYQNQNKNYFIYNDNYKSNHFYIIDKNKIIYNVDKKSDNLLFKNDEFNKFLEQIKNEIIQKNLLYNLNLKIKLTIKKIEGNIKDNLIINCEYTSLEPKIYDIKINEYQDTIILKNKNIEGFQNFIKYIIKILYENYLEIEKNINNIEKSALFSNLSSIKALSNRNTQSSNLTNLYQLLVKFKKFKIIQFISSIGKHDKTADYIKELSDGNIISGGYNGHLFIYNIKDNYKKEEIKKECYYAIEVGKEKDNKNNKNKLIICSKKEYYIYSLKEKSLIENKIDITIKNLFPFKNKQFIVCGEYDIYLFKDLESKIISSTNDKIRNKSYFGGIKINEDLIAITSNKILSKGEDNLLIYNSNSKKFNSQEIKGYSYILSRNNLYLMPIPEEFENKENKLMFCACKKYIAGQKNGILLLKLILNDNIQIYKEFINTGNFEVYCFCHIFIIKNEYILGNEENESVKYHTQYFFVGGFDIDKNEGKIKLYKVIYNKDIKKTKIQYIQDIQIENNKSFNGFRGAITCILQSTINGNILISCFDGNVYLFTEPDVNELINYENKKLSFIKQDKKQPLIYY